MTNIRSYSQLVSRFQSNYDAEEPFYADQQATTTSTLFTGQTLPINAYGWTTTFPTPLPTGVSAYIITSIEATNSSGIVPVLAAKAISLGSLNIGTNTFTAGSTMPTITEGNASHQTYSAVMAEVTTVLNSAPGNYTITYNANDGSTSNTTSAVAITASAVLHTAGPVVLNGAHWGVSQITAASQSGGTSPSGVITFWGLLPICMFGAGWTSGEVLLRNLITAGFNPFRLGAGDVVKFFQLNNAAAAKCITGTLHIIGDS